MRQAALLRAVNVGGRKVVMSELRALCEGAGYAGVRTLLASGNLVLDAKAKGAKLESELEALIQQGFGLKSEVFVRTHAELLAVIDANPFPDFAARDPSHFVVLFLREKPDAALRKALEAPQGGPEQVRAVGRELFVTFPDGQARTKLKLKVLGTARNWNTVAKLAEMTGGA